MTTKPTRRRQSISLATDPLTQPAAAAESAAATAAATPPTKAPKAAAKTTTTRATTSKPAVKKPEPEMIDPDLLVGERSWGEETYKMTVNIPVSLHQRAAGLTFQSQFTGEPEGYSSLTDLVRIGLDELITRAEKKFNNGNPYPAPKGGLRRGRR